jgi:hypothetical protein
MPKDFKKQLINLLFCGSRVQDALSDSPLSKVPQHLCPYMYLHRSPSQTFLPKNLFFKKIQA